jgi:hypothetical protein
MGFDEQLASAASYPTDNIPHRVFNPFLHTVTPVVSEPYAYRLFLAGGAG